jgi:Spy/CpxP family protein refolding chaperone
METMRALRQSLGAEKPDEAKIKPLLNTLENNHRSIQDIRNAELKGLKEILNVEQQARFLVFQQEFQHEMRGMIEGARGGPRQRPGIGGASGQGWGQRAPDRYPQQ